MTALLDRAASRGASHAQGFIAVLVFAGALGALAHAQSDPLAAIDRLQGEVRTRALVEAAD